MASSTQIAAAITAIVVAAWTTALQCTPGAASMGAPLMVAGAIGTVCC